MTQGIRNEEKESIDIQILCSLMCIQKKVIYRIKDIQKATECREQLGV